MKGWLFTGTDQPFQLGDIEPPVAGPGEAVLEVKAAGLCHSDVGTMHDPKWLALMNFLPIVMGHEVAGGQRWLRLGPLSFQPSETAKFALVLLLAVKLTQGREYTHTFLYGLLPAMLIAGTFAGLVFAERDLGIPFMMVVAATVMIFVAGAGVRQLAGAGMLVAAGLVAAIKLAPILAGCHYCWMARK